ncbi:MAG: alpha/beta hydrolase [Candidatus Poribacteria bacterium]|nr:alpha/beta hydrolase [Candidatus Poribacteria bacterium]
METFHIKVEVPPIGKIPVFVRRWGGNTRKVLLVHGWMDSSRRWHRLAPDLASQYEIWALDLPGFGHTPLIPRCHATLKMYSEVVAGLSKQISEGKGLHGVIGHSMGGILSLLLLKAPRLAVKRIIACGPPIKGVYYLKPLANRTRFVATCLSVFQAFRAGVRKLTAERVTLGAHGVPEYPKDGRRVLPDAYADALTAAILLKQTCNYNLFGELDILHEEASQELASVDSGLRYPETATFIMRGQHDPFCSRHTALQLAETLGSVFHEVPGCLHVPFVERPSVTYPVLRKFLD